MAVKVLILGKRSNPETGGIERFNLDLAHSFVNAGHEVTLVTTGSNFNIVESRDSNFKQLTLKSTNRIASIDFALPPEEEFFRSLKEADLVIHNFPNPVLDFYSLKIPKENRVCVFHGNPTGKFHRFLSPLIEPILDSCSKIFCLHFSTQQLLKKKEWREKSVSMNYVCNDWFDPDLQKDGSFVLSVGRLVNYKGYTQLIQTWTPEMPRLFIAGGGPNQRSLESEVKHANLQNVEILGQVTDRQLRKLYNSCRIFLMNSNSNQETFCISAQEALSCGKPLLLPRLNTAVEKHIVEGKNGYIFEPSNFLQRNKLITKLWNSKQLREQMSSRSRSLYLELDRSLGPVSETIVRYIPI